MVDSLWVGIGAGIATIGLHAGTRLFTHYLSLRTSDRKLFLLVELGGLGGRMVLVFGVVVLVLLYVPVHEIAYVSTVIVLLLGSMVVEVRLIVRRMDQGTLAS